MREGTGDGIRSAATGEDMQRGDLTRGRFNREALPKPSAYFKARGLRLKGRNEWRVTTCTVCGTPDALLVRTSGAFHCMACEAKGGDLLALHMAETGRSFAAAARALGAWEVAP